MGDGWLYDGRSAAPQPVRVVAGADGRLHVERDGGSDALDPALLTHADSRADAEVYARADVPGWRLTLARPVAPELAARLPGARRYGRWIDRIGLAPAAALFLLASAAVLAGGHFAPAVLAPLVPAGWEQRYGDAIVGDFGGKFCRGPGGQEGLEKLAAKLAPGPVDFDIRVVDVPMVNAAALPGNHIVLFRELLTGADGPDEVAGVLAHEIAHVKNRHVTEGMIRELGVGMIITALGGTTGGNADMLIGSRYSREAEAEADRDAIAMLARAGISPIPTSKFFARIGRGEKSLGRVGETLSYISTHPMSEGRRAAFAQSFKRDRRYVPALDRDEWEAVFNICFNDPRKRAEREAVQRRIVRDGR